MKEDKSVNGWTNLICGSKCHPWIEETHSWIKVSSVDVIHGWRNLIHLWHPRIMMTDEGHGQSICNARQTDVKVLKVEIVMQIGFHVSFYMQLLRSSMLSQWFLSQLSSYVPIWKVSSHLAGLTLNISNWGIFTSLEMSTGKSFFHRRINSFVVLETENMKKRGYELFLLNFIDFIFVHHGSKSIEKWQID